MSLSRLLASRRIKRFVEENLPRESSLHKAILAEKDELDAESFLSKSEVWLRLVDISSPQTGFSREMTWT